MRFTVPLAFAVGFLILLSACGETPARPEAGLDEVPRPSNPGGPGEAINRIGDPATGQAIYAAYCRVCHGVEGRSLMANPGATDEVIPGLNPVDPALYSTDERTFATNLDLYIEHGSTPAGSPALIMPAWGDNGALDPQQIADVIAYLIELNR
ncbi:MAG: cytochrome c [Anaerolineales bacterium]|nr:cytochrome c [Anaerolineales bacterium]